MCKISAVAKNVRKGCSTCGKDGCARGGAKVELVVRRRGRKTDCRAKVSTQYVELLVGGGRSRLGRKVMDTPGQTLARKARRVKVLAVGMRQGEFERLIEQGDAVSIVGEDREDRCFVEHAFGRCAFCC